MKLSVGQLLQVYLTQSSMTQADLAKSVGCSRAFISMVMNDRKRPGVVLAGAIAATVATDVLEQEGLRFFLLRNHQAIVKIEKDYPNAIEDFRTAGNREDDEGLRIC